MHTGGCNKGGQELRLTSCYIWYIHVHVYTSLSCTGRMHRTATCRLPHSFKEVRLILKDQLYIYMIGITVCMWTWPGVEPPRRGLLPPACCPSQHSSWLEGHWLEDKGWIHSDAPSLQTVLLCGTPCQVCTYAGIRTYMSYTRALNTYNQVNNILVLHHMAHNIEVYCS